MKNFIRKMSSCQLKNIHPSHLTDMNSENYYPNNLLKNIFVQILQNKLLN